jgi:rhodanese-related sulfurtransferase
VPQKPRTTSLKTAIYERIARIGQAAASSNRLELFALLSQGPRTVEVLAQQTGLSAATTSHHLQVLRRARLADAEKAGLCVTYRLADPQVGDSFVERRRSAESRLAEAHQVTQQYLERRGALEPVDDEELVRRVRDGEVTVIDVRPREEYVAGRIPGAIAGRLAERPKRLRHLPKRHDMVAYCPGRYCVMALDAVDLLRRKGIRAHRLEQGVAEWRAQGWRVATGDERGTGSRA